MVLLYLFLLLIIIPGLKWHNLGFRSDYIGKEQCNGIKGIFIIVVFFRHIVPYLTKSGYEMSGKLDILYNGINFCIGQLLVVMFFFYSGFGVMESIQNKGKNYVNAIPKRRILSTLINYDIAVCCYALLAFIVGRDVSIWNFFTSLIAWTSLGNSNWYIFVILICYILTFLSFRLLCMYEKWGGLFLLIVLTLMVLGGLYLSKTEIFYNTIMCYPAGMFYSYYKSDLETFVHKHFWLCLFNSASFFLIGLIATFFIGRGVLYNFTSLLFAFIVVMLTMKIYVGNKFLLWCGANLFPIYIYQRIPMISVRYIAGDDWVSSHAFLYITICLIVTFFISYQYKYWKVELK